RVLSIYQPHLHATTHCQTHSYAELTKGPPELGDPHDYRTHARDYGRHAQRAELHQFGLGSDSADGHWIRGAEPDSADRLRCRQRARDLRARDPDEERGDHQQHRLALGVPAGDAVYVLERAAMGGNGREDP